MNLHNIAGNYVSAVNPWVTASIQMSDGYTTAANLSRAPKYKPAINVAAQMQALTYNDLVQVSGLNIQGEKRAMYLNGDWKGVSRQDNKGGDIITLSDGSIWLVIQVLENWQFMDGWVKVAVVRQQ